MQQPVRKAYILVSREASRVQLAGAQAAKTLASILKTCLGPRAMQKMLITKINSIELTNDGNYILREMDVSHPSVRCLIEVCQTQDDECGDGTTSAIVLAGELLSETSKLLKEYHPIRLCNALKGARDAALQRLSEIACNVSEDNLLQIVKSAVSTKICSILRVPIPDLALKAAKLVKNSETNEVDIKNDIKVVKILGDLAESEVFEGIIIEKSLIHCQMRRRIENPKILLIDTPLEYKKGESITNYEFRDSQQFKKALEAEEKQVEKYCNMIVALKPDLVIVEKGISDLALSILFENNIAAFRRVKKSDMNRIAKATGAVIVNRIEDLEERYIGTASLYEYIKINQEHYFKLSGCDNRRIVSAVLRGPSNDILGELERNFMDAIKVAKNIIRSPKLLPGGGSTEYSIYKCLTELAERESDKLKKDVYSASATAFTVIPSILAINSGVSSGIGVLNKLNQAYEENAYVGVNGVTGAVEDMRKIVMEPMIVKEQCVKSAFEAVMQLLRVDSIIECKSQ